MNKVAEKFCFSKKILFPVFLVVLLVIYFVFSIFLNKSKNILQSKAAPPIIIGGVDVKPGEFPAVVKVITKNEVPGGFEVHECTGTLVAPRWVLTAAHCLDHIGEISVAIGITNISQFTNKAIKASFKILHPDYKTKSIDIGLILLEKEITGITFPKFPSSNLYKKNHIVIAVGWGCTGFEPTPAYSENSYWKTCSQFKTEDDCDLKGGVFSCGYQTACNACIPWNLTNFDYHDCNVIKQRINEVDSNRAISPLPSSNSITALYGDTLQKISLPIITDFSRPNKHNLIFEIGYKDDKAKKKNICPGDSGGPSLYKNQFGLYILGVNVAVVTERYTEIPIGPAFVVNVMEFSDWINAQITEYTSQYPVAKLPEFVVDTRYDSIWKTCSQFKTMNECDLKGRPLECGYQALCNVCMPWNDKFKIDMYDCPNIVEKINRVNLSN